MMFPWEGLSKPGWHVSKGMKRLVKKDMEDPKLRKEFEAWFQKELKKSVEEDKEILRVLD